MKWILRYWNEIEMKWDLKWNDSNEIWLKLWLKIANDYELKRTSDCFDVDLVFDAVVIDVDGVEEPSEGAFLGHTTQLDAAPIHQQFLHFLLDVDHTVRPFQRRYRVTRLLLLLLLLIDFVEQLRLGQHRDGVDGRPAESCRATAFARRTRSCAGGEIGRLHPLQEGGRLVVVPQTAAPQPAEHHINQLEHQSNQLSTVMIV